MEVYKYLSCSDDSFCDPDPHFQSQNAKISSSSIFPYKFNAPKKVASLNYNTDKKILPPEVNSAKHKLRRSEKGSNLSEKEPETTKEHKDFYSKFPEFKSPAQVPASKFDVPVNIRVDPMYIRKSAIPPPNKPNPTTPAKSPKPIQQFPQFTPRRTISKEFYLLGDSMKSPQSPFVIHTNEPPTKILGDVGLESTSMYERGMGFANSLEENGVSGLRDEPIKSSVEDAVRSSPDRIRKRLFAYTPMKLGSKSNSPGYGSDLGTW